MGRLSAILILSFLFTSALGPVIGQDLGSMDKARDDALQAYEVQRDLPGYDVEEQNEIDPFENPEEDEDSQTVRSIFEFLKSLATPIKALFILGLVVLALFILRAIYLNKDAILAAFRRREKPVEQKIEPHAIDIERVKDRLDDAKALAAQGRYEEAVHLLLLHTIEDVKRQKKDHIPTCWTAREILKKSALPSKAVAAMQSIVGVVELSFFGGHAIGQAGYERCISDYESFIALLEGKPA